MSIRVDLGIALQRLADPRHPAQSIEDLLLVLREALQPEKNWEVLASKIYVPDVLEQLGDRARAARDHLQGLFSKSHVSAKDLREAAIQAFNAAYWSHHLYYHACIRTGSNLDRLPMHSGKRDDDVFAERLALLEEVGGLQQRALQKAAQIEASQTDVVEYTGDASSF